MAYDFNIRRDYASNDLPMPDMIFGWEYPPEQRKPGTYALEVISQKYDVNILLFYRTYHIGL